MATQKGLGKGLGALLGELSMGGKAVLVPDQK